MQVVHVIPSDGSMPLCVGNKRVESLLRWQWYAFWWGPCAPANPILHWCLQLPIFHHLVLQRLHMPTIARWYVLAAAIDGACVDDYLCFWFYSYCFSFGSLATLIWVLVNRSSGHRCGIIRSRVKVLGPFAASRHIVLWPLFRPLGQSATWCVLDGSILLGPFILWLTDFQLYCLKVWRIMNCRLLKCVGGPLAYHIAYLLMTPYYF